MKHLLLTDALGIYIPKRFAENYETELYDRNGEPIDLKEYLDDLTNPDNEHYWESWEYVLDHACIKDTQGKVYFLHQDGDLWAVDLKLYEELDEDAQDKFWDNMI